VDPVKPEEDRRIKRAARELLAKLKAKRLRVQDWRAKQATRDAEHHAHQR